MFAGARPKFPLLTPMISPEYAATTIVSAVRRNRQTVLMPLSAHLVPILKGVLPAEVGVEVAQWFGTLDAMDTFTGRAGGAAPAAKAKSPAPKRASKSPAKKR